MQNTEAKRIGRRLFQEGLLGGNFGNLSLRVKGGFEITATGAFLDEPGDLVFVSDEGVATPGASSEYRVHSAVYEVTGAEAIVHAHPAHAVAASLISEKIIPVDSEGMMLCPVIPVAEGEPGTEDLARNVAEALKDAPVAVARGHGTFARGSSLEEAYLLTSIAEHACRVIFLKSCLQHRSL